jgi:anaerobic ribonucleoside-triphosphate reductase activating protein
VRIFNQLSYTFLDYPDNISQAVLVYFSGCDNACEGCQNPDLQDSTKGYIVDTSMILEHLRQFPDFYQSIVFLGGEPTEQEYALLELCNNLPVTLIKILYTGKQFEDLSEDVKSAMDIIVDGPYIKSEPTESGFPASKNQRIWEHNILTNNDFRKNSIGRKTKRTNW